MLFLVFCGLEENGCDLLIAFLLSYGCEIGVLVSCLGLACESGHKILFSLGALKVIHGLISFEKIHFNY